MFEIGSVLSVNKLNGLINHVGLYIGDGKVLHNSPGIGEKVVTVEEFSKGRDVSIVYKIAINKSTFFKRVKNIVKNPLPYSLFGNNCEHTVSRVVNGTSRSSQLQQWSLIGFAFLLIKSLR